MSSEREIHTAFLEAERLRTDPAFQFALTEARKDAVDALVATDPSQIDKMRDAQATVRAIDGLTTKIADAILRWKALRKQEPKQD